MVALFFLSVVAGHHAGRHPRRLLQPENEVPYFSCIGGTAIVLGVALAAATPAMKKLMGGVR